MKKRYLLFIFLLFCGVIYAAGSYTALLNLYKPAQSETGWATAINNNFDAIDTAVGTEHNTNGTHKTDVIDDTNIDWGTGAAQVSADDIPDGSTNVITTSTQETNFGTAYTHSTTDADTSASNEIQDIFKTISSQSGNTTANSSTDTITINGAGIASTAISGDTLTITATEVDGSTTNELPVAGNDIDVSTATVSIESQLDYVTTIDRATDGNLTLSTSGDGDHIILAPMSNVGIGTTSPSQKFDLVGNAEITGTLTTTGNVGLGTTSTANALTVAGTAVLNGLTVDSNTVNLSDTTDEYVLAFDTGTQTWRGVVSSGGTTYIQISVYLDGSTNESDNIIRIKENVTLTGWDLVSDNGNNTVTVDVWMDTYANFPPTNEDTITNGHEPAISATTKGQDTDISDWSDVTLVKGDYLKFNTDTNSAGQGAWLFLYGTKD